MGYKTTAAMLFAGVSAIALPTFANAQAAATAQVDEVVVTGSRIISNGNTMPTPVTVVQAQDVLKLQPTTVADALNNLPTFTGSRNQFSNPNSSTLAGAGANGAANQLNLRGIGAVRTLILFDGHRVPSTSTNGIVDVDMIPQLLLQRTEVVTGGVSAVYGSDAVSGVVNFITDRRFNGLKVEAQSGVSAQTDGRNYRIGAAFGTNVLGDRGHFEASVERYEDKGILNRSSRKWNKLWAVSGAGTAANPYRLTSNVHVSNYTFGGIIQSGVFADQTFKTNGVLSPFVHGVASGTPNTELGGEGAYYDASLKSPLTTNQGFARFDYDFSDKVHGYAAVTGNLKDNEQYIVWHQLTNLTLSTDNAFLPASYRTAMLGAGQNTFRFSKLLQQAERQHFDIKSQQYMVNLGLDGQIGDGYKWEAYYTHSASRLDNRNLTNLNNGKVAAASDAVIDPASGQAVCRVTLTNPNVYPGCVPLNLFGPTSGSDAALKYIVDQTRFVANTLNDEFGGSVSGEVFKLPAGPVSMAVSGEWRRQAYRALTNSPSTQLPNCTGLRFNCTATTAQWFVSFSNRSRVSQSVYEGALEAEAPILKDLPLIQSLSINGAVRYTDYDTSGSYKTWKVGADWHVTDDLRFRATRSRDIRAPTLDDLFAPTSINGLVVLDLLTNTTPPISIAVGGNPSLKAEEGATTTAGVVWKPSQIPGFNVALDYYNIKITDAISTIQGFGTAQQQACYASGGTSPYCLLQVRPNGYKDTSASNAVTLWKSTVINVAEVTSNGVDFEANYASRAFERPYSMRLLTTYQPHLKTVTPGLSSVDNAGAGSTPVYKVSTFLRVSPFDNFNVDILYRWRSKLKLTGDPTVFVVGPKIDSVGFANLNLSYDLKRGFGSTNIYLNIQNIFDTQPPGSAATGASTIPGQFGGFVAGDDPVGRYFTFGVRFRR